MHVMLESNKSAKPSAFGTTSEEAVRPVPRSEYRMIYTSTGGNEFNDMSFMPNRTEKMGDICFYPSLFFPIFALTLMKIDW